MLILSLPPFLTTYSHLINPDSYKCESTIGYNSRQLGLSLVNTPRQQDDRAQLNLFS
ncbi:MAG TPA: hypothetical protein V6C85_02400 [Allocoleopsis sp.]